MKGFLIVAIAVAVLLSVTAKLVNAQSQGQPVKSRSASDEEAAKKDLVLAGSRQQQERTAAQPVQEPPKSCLAVRPIGSHVFRNVMLFGVTGALISKQQYQVVDALNYPARIGQKYHGDDLQAISTGGLKVIILDKHYTTEDLHKACSQ